MTVSRRSRPFGPRRPCAPIPVVLGDRAKSRNRPFPRNTGYRLRMTTGGTFPPMSTAVSETASVTCGDLTAGSIGPA